jgi:hypothetical protein
VGDFGFRPNLCVVLATALFAGFANAATPYAFAPVAAYRAQSSLTLVQAFHKPPGVPGTNDSSDASDLGGSSNGAHAPPSVPNFSGSGGGSGLSHVAPGLPSFGDDGGNAAAQSHAPPPAPNEAGVSHAAPGVPMMGGDP